MMRYLLTLLLLSVCSVANAHEYVRVNGRLYVKQSIVIVEAPKKRAYDPYKHMMYNYVQRRYGPAPYRVERRVKTRTLYIPAEMIRNPYTRR